MLIKMTLNLNGKQLNGDKSHKKRKIIGVESDGMKLTEQSQGNAQPRSYKILMDEFIAFSDYYFIICEIPATQNVLSHVKFRNFRIIYSCVASCVSAL